MVETQANPTPSIVIVGSGIAGLSTGLFIKCAVPDAKVTILEQHSSLSLLGGVILTPSNATRIINSVGLLQSFKSIAEDASVHLLKHGESDEVFHTRYDNALGPAPYLITMRGEFTTWLYNHFCERGGTVLFQQRVTKIEETPESVRLETEQGAVFTADLLVAADGVRSSLRSILNIKPNPKLPSSSDACITTCEVSSELMLKDPVLAKLYNHSGTSIWMGRGRYIISASMPRKNIYAVAFFDDGPETPWHAPWVVPGDLQKVKHRYSGFGDSPKRLINAAIATENTRKTASQWTTVIVGPFRGWRSKFGRAVLLGDAAHAMVPDAGQGAAQCLESAFALSLFVKSMQSAADIPRLTERYQDFRKSRVEKIQGIARNNSASYRKKTAPGNSFASGQDFSWLFGYDITKEISLSNHVEDAQAIPKPCL